MSIEPQIRYAQTVDGVSIAFWTLGEGRPVFMNSPLTFSHSGLEVQIPRIAAMYWRVAADAMLVRWDNRNYGLSQRGVERLGIDDWAADVFAVADKLDVDEFDLVGINYPPGVAALQPERVGRAVIVGPPSLEHTAAGTLVRALAADLGWPYVEGEHVRPIVARALGRREHAVVSAPALSEQEERALAGELRPVRFVHLRRPAPATQLDRTTGPLDLDPAAPHDQILRRIRYEFGL